MESRKAAAGMRPPAVMDEGKTRARNARKALLIDEEKKSFLSGRERVANRKFLK